MSELQPKFPGEIRIESVTLSDYVPASRQVQSLTLKAAPSGAGELALANLTVSGSAAQFTVSDGQPTREYTLVFSAPLDDGEEIEWELFQTVKPYLAGDLPQDAPSLGFGTPLSWTPPPSTPAILIAAAG